MAAVPYIILCIKAKHYAGTSFNERPFGLFYNAIRDIEKYRNYPIIEGDTFIQIGENVYDLCEEYTGAMYVTDTHIAIENLYNDTQLRILKLKLNTNVPV